MAPEHNSGGGVVRRGAENGELNALAQYGEGAAGSQMSPGPFVLPCVSVFDNKSGAPAWRT